MHYRDNVWRNVPVRGTLAPNRIVVRPFHTLTHDFDQFILIQILHSFACMFHSLARASLRTNSSRLESALAFHLGGNWTDWISQSNRSILGRAHSIEACLIQTNLHRLINCCHARDGSRTHKPDELSSKGQRQRPSAESGSDIWC